MVTLYIDAVILKKGKTIKKLTLAKPTIKGTAGKKQIHRAGVVGTGALGVSKSARRQATT